MSSRRLPSALEPVTDANGVMTHNWYLALQSLTGSGVAINDATPTGSSYFLDWSQAGETRVKLTRPASRITQQGAADGQRCSLVLIQSSVGGNLVTFTGETNFGAGGAPTLSTGAGLRDRLQFVFNADSGVYDFIGIAKGF